ncbi:8654_t:CDS:1, partial [Paraglomus brasilianum]
ILPIVNLNEELDINDDDLIEELCTDVKGFHLRNETDVNEYINYSEENETEEIPTDQEIVVYEYS